MTPNAVCVWVLDIVLVDGLPLVGLVVVSVVVVVVAGVGVFSSVYGLSG